MAQYIDKADIEKILSKLWKEDDGHNSEHRICYNKALQEVQCELDTLEVTEEPVSEDLEEAIVQSFIYHDNRGDDFRSDEQIETAYRYGFKSGVKYKESTSSIIKDIEKQNLEVKEVDLEEEINRFWDSCAKHKNERGGNVIWSNKLEVEVLARHFFELGLKAAQKGE